MSLKKHGTILLNGVAVVAPALITAYVVVTALLWLDDTVRRALDTVLHTSFRGLGVVVGVALIYVIGLLARSWLFGWLIELGEAIVEKIPLVKTLYSAVRDLVKFLGPSDAESRGKPALVDFEDGRVRLLGLITQEETGRLGVEDPDKVAVYLPMSYQIGGFTVVVPRDSVEQVEGMSVEELLKLAMTAGVGAAKGQKGAKGTTQQTEGK